jgi:DnaJ-like protein
MELITGTAKAQPGMTEKKPPNVSWESWIDRKIRESMEAGDFDNLPGSGQPILELARPYDELWWLRKKLREEQLSIDPPTLVLRREYADTLAQIAAARSEGEVRRLVAAINERIIYVNSHTTFGPPSDLVPLNVERVVADWRAAQEATSEGGSAAGSAG